MVLAAVAGVAGLAQQGAVNCHEALAGYRENRTPFEVVRLSCPPEVAAAIVGAGPAPGALPPAATGRVIDPLALAVLSRTLPDT